MFLAFLTETLTAQEWGTLVVKIIGLSVSILPTIVSVSAVIKKMIKDKNWQLAVQITQEAMVTVENYAKLHPSITSSQKLDMALAGVKSGLKTAGITCDNEMLTKVTEYITEMCNLSKKVN